MSRDKKIKGEEGEDLATEFLKTHKYKILERNFRLRNGEVDIIGIDYSEKQPVLAFIEVKTRNSSEYGSPLEAITYFKLKALLRSAQVYKTFHPRLPDLMRLDLVSVTFSGNKPIIELIKNISE